MRRYARRRESEVNDENGAKKLETCVTLYKQQMEHYHKTQDVEWKGTFGAWTIVAVAVATARGCGYFLRQE
jgi:hypothetical protein